MSEKPYFVHESSYVDEPCQIGAGTKIWHFSHVMANCVIGPRCNIGQNVVVSPGVRMGEGCKIQNNVSLYTGANATIVCGITIGQYAFVGAGAVVTHDVPDFALVVGNPGRRTDWICRCGVKLAPEGHRARCEACGARYAITAGVMALDN